MWLVEYIYFPMYVLLRRNLRINVLKPNRFMTIDSKNVSRSEKLS